MAGSSSFKPSIAPNRGAATHRGQKNGGTMGEYTGATALGDFRGTDRMAELAGATEGGVGGRSEGQTEGRGGG
jgi:hypothetical protein